MNKNSDLMITIYDNIPSIPTPNVDSINITETPATILPLSEESLKFPNRPIGEIATDFDNAVHELEELYTSGDAYYLVWLKQNEERLKAQSARDLISKTSEKAKEVSRLQSELVSATTSLSRRFGDIRSKL